MEVNGDFSELHKQFWRLFKEDPLGFTIHHPNLIMLKKINGLKVTCLMSLYFKSEEDTMKNISGYVCNHVSPRGN